MDMFEFDPYPIEISVAVYDLLPEGKLSSLGWFTGCGLYHSAIRIQDFDVEYTYGGHDQPQTSGVFGIPCGPRDPILPGLRFLKMMPLGLAFGGAWRRVIEKQQAAGDDDNDDQSDRAQLLSHMQPSPQGPSSSSSHRPKRQETRDETLQRILQVIESFQRNRDWDGPSYDLLNRNCNHFSDALAFALTGQHVPPWINRAAWIGLQLPCLVPPGWVEPPEAQLDEHGEPVGQQQHSSSQTSNYEQHPTPQMPRLDTRASQ